MGTIVPPIKLSDEVC